MSFFNSVNIAASGLTAQRLRMDVIAENIANVNTTRTADGGPFQRRTVLFEQIPREGPFHKVFGDTLTGYQGEGVRVSHVIKDPGPGHLVYDPTHPDADEAGYVRMPNVNIVEEMVNMISASRSYEANITSMTSFRGIIARTLEIGRGN
ncbi:MAG: flagellar basal body rod protein FlgC [Defluviitaleaceae bacterium]|nr:flagellar basal body rod protein FlgC [Defluviitaleaceae bacterium]